MERREWVALVVDEQVTGRRLLRNRLMAAGFAGVLESAEDRKAWNLLRSFEPRVDLVVCDGDGDLSAAMNLLRRIRRDPRLADLPFVMVSEDADRGSVREWIRAGVSRYLVKPFTQELFKQTVHRALALAPEMCGEAAGAGPVESASCA
jgi:two-component system chemotaxis response regulator CheY